MFKNVSVNTFTMYPFMDPKIFDVCANTLTEIIRKYQKGVKNANVINLIQNGVVHVNCFSEIIN